MTLILRLRRMFFFFFCRMTFDLTLEAFSNYSELLLPNVRKCKIPVSWDNIRFWNQISPKLYDKTFEKINIKTLISI